MLRVVPKPVERIVFRGDVAAIGAFRCGVDDPLYRNSGPCSDHTFAFPRTSTAIRHDGGAHFVGSPKTVSFYNRGQVYFRDAIDAIDATDWFVVADDILIDAIRSYDPRVDDRPDKPFPFAHGPASSATYLSQRVLFECATRMDIEESILAILDEVLAAAFRSSKQTKPKRDAVEDAKRAIVAAPSESLSLRQLAALAGCSPFHLCRAFRQITGETITSFRRDLRLRLSLERVRDSDLTDLALDLGFASHSHFTASFRRQFGFPPSAVRAMA